MYTHALYAIVYSGHYPYYSVDEARRPNVCNAPMRQSKGFMWGAAAWWLALSFQPPFRPIVEGV